MQAAGKALDGAKIGFKVMLCQVLNGLTGQFSGQ
jgi:hypothetical protein